MASERMPLNARARIRLREVADSLLEEVCDELDYCRRKRHSGCPDKRLAADVLMQVAEATIYSMPSHEPVTWITAPTLPKEEA